uniref:Uncharacterized protein n=1 Tax=Oryza brachyantha TaxID=4533 RepID=J3L2Z2_ORYBR
MAKRIASCGKVLMFIYLLGSFVAQGDMMHRTEPSESIWEQDHNNNKLTIIPCFQTSDCISIGTESLSQIKKSCIEGALSFFLWPSDSSRANEAGSCLPWTESDISNRMKVMGHTFTCFFPGGYSPGMHAHDVQIE